MNKNERGIIMSMKKVNMECPFCGSNQEVYLCCQKTVTEIKKQQIEYEANYFLCKNCKEKFEDGEMLNNNLSIARDTYRKENHLLTSDEIAQIRKKYKLSQADFSLALGWGEITITRYETKQIQDSTYDMVLRLVDKDPFMFLQILENNKNSFTEDKYKSIEENIRSTINESTIQGIMLDRFKNHYAVYNEPSQANGYTVLSIENLNNIIGIILSKTSYMYKVQLMKTLWYIDYLYYEKTGTSATGLVYEHQRLGALPIGNNALLYLPAIDSVEEYYLNGNMGYRLSLSKNFVPSKVSKGLEEIIDRVVKKFENKTTKEIVEYMHKEKAYLNTKEMEIIPFSKEFKLNKF